MGLTVKHKLDPVIYRVQKDKKNYGSSCSETVEI
jgi:hypothetical protein